MCSLTTGPAGPIGPPGPSPTVTSFTGSKGTCTEGQGGLEVKSGSSTTFVCNGVDGESGFTEVLPPGETETGVWDMTTLSGTPPRLLLPFNIPLAAALPAGQVHYINGAGQEWNGTTYVAQAGNCDGSAAAPKADEGHLCVYEERQITVGGAFNPTILDPATEGPGPFFESLPGASVAGALLTDFGTDYNGLANGTWAVTGG